ncbi:MAG: tRNA 4-thiouridine(8) synthase ThiI [Treponema sp.]|nr:tRNA 4-thiouridine(8) synthase ThiI [Treponema sp.]
MSFNSGREGRDLSGYTQQYLGKLGELTLKGANKKVFEKQLVKNARQALDSVQADVFLRNGRLYVRCTEESCEAVEYVLDRLIGITGWAKVRAVEKDIDEIRRTVCELCVKARDSGARTFKLEARREDKSFPMNSYEICVEAAGDASDGGILDVDVHNPDVVVNVEIRDMAYVYSSQHRTCRGLPVGVSGKGLLLLSGGLDSPVAGYRMMARGMKVDCVYFHSYPYTSEEAQKKVEDLAKILGDYGCETYLNVISFTDVQMQIKKSSPEPFATLMLRLCMMKAANMLAEKIHASAIITGESLGQVASQTVENLALTESFAEHPLYRPLIGQDKEEIVSVAERIGTYGISILPYEDCCVLFSPKHPVLRADLDEARKIYEGMDVDALIQKAFDERQIIHYSLEDTVAGKFGKSDVDA